MKAQGHCADTFQTEQLFEEELFMNAYLASVLENVKTKHGNEPEFVQTVE